MSIIKVEDIAYVRFAAPDLDEMRRFLTEFGLTEAASDATGLYFRGTGPAPFLHATVKGEPGFRGIGLRAASLDDLEKLAASEGAPVEPLDAPGGGSCVRLTDPDGIAVEIVAGQSPAAALSPDPDRPINTSARRTRLREPVRLEAGPSHVARLGHAVLEVTDFRTSEAWYKERFGFLTSDEIEAEPGGAIGAFMRCDRGETPTDHHTLFLLQAGKSGFNHAAFEVLNFDDLMRGHWHLQKAKRTPAWGVGRHILGSQIFDYWKDPWGHELEHWTDGDLFAASDPPNKADMGALLGTQWGEKHPIARMMEGDA